MRVVSESELFGTADERAEKAAAFVEALRGAQAEMIAKVTHRRALVDWESVLVSLEPEDEAVMVFRHGSGDDAVEVRMSMPFAMVPETLNHAVMRRCLAGASPSRVQ